MESTSFLLEVSLTDVHEHRETKVSNREAGNLSSLSRVSHLNKSRLFIGHLDIVLINLVRNVEEPHETYGA